MLSCCWMGPTRVREDDSRVPKSIQRELISAGSLALDPPQPWREETIIPNVCEEAVGTRLQRVIHARIVTWVQKSQAGNTRERISDSRLLLGMQNHRRGERGNQGRHETDTRLSSTRTKRLKIRTMTTYTRATKV